MTTLPPGQHELGEFPRFGLRQFIRRFPAETHQVSVKIAGDIDESFTVTDELRDLFRCQDGYASSLPLADLLASTVLLADRLNDEATAKSTSGGSR